MGGWDQLPLRDRSYDPEKGWISEYIRKDVTKNLTPFFIFSIFLADKLQAPPLFIPLLYLHWARKPMHYVLWYQQKLTSSPSVGILTPAPPVAAPSF